MASSMALRRLASGILLRPRGGLTLSSFAPAATRSFSSFNPATINPDLLLSTGRCTTFSSAAPRDPTRDYRFMVYVEPRGGSRGITGEVKEDEEGLHLKAAMPNLAAEDVVMYMHEDKYLFISDKEVHESPYDQMEMPRTIYYACIEITPKCYRSDRIKASLKNGQLNVTIPKKRKERNDLVFIKVD